MEHQNVECVMYNVDTVMDNGGHYNCCNKTRHYPGSSCRSLSSTSSPLTTLRFFQLLKNFLMRFSRNQVQLIR